MHFSIKLKTFCDFLSIMIYKIISMTTSLLCIIIFTGYKNVLTPVCYGKQEQNIKIFKYQPQL